MSMIRWFFTKEELENTPSRKCGMDADKELSQRQQAANFIQDMGQRLQVTQLCINTAIVYMHRFYVFHSFTHFHRNALATAALFLAAKVEEQPRKLEHIVKVAQVCLQKSQNQSDARRADQFAEQTQELVVNENILLQTLGFDVAIDHPHSYVVRCCRLVGASKDLSQTSYFMASNSLHLTTMCLQYRPTVVACFCIHLACKWSNLQIPLSNEGKEWYTYVDPHVTIQLLETLTNEFLNIFDKCPSRLKKRIMLLSDNTKNASLSSYPFDADVTRKLNSAPHHHNSHHQKKQQPHQQHTQHAHHHHAPLAPDGVTFNTAEVNTVPSTGGNVGTSSMYGNIGMNGLDMKSSSGRDALIKAHPNVTFFPNSSSNNNNNNNNSSHVTANAASAGQPASTTNITAVSSSVTHKMPPASVNSNSNVSAHNHLGKISNNVHSAVLASGGGSASAITSNSSSSRSGTSSSSKPTANNTAQNVANPLKVKPFIPNASKVVPPSAITSKSSTTSLVNARPRKEEVSSRYVSSAHHPEIISNCLKEVIMKNETILEAVSNKNTEKKIKAEPKVEPFCSLATTQMHQPSIVVNSSRSIFSPPHLQNHTDAATDLQKPIIQRDTPSVMAPAKMSSENHKLNSKMASANNHSYHHQYHNDPDVTTSVPTVLSVPVVKLEPLDDHHSFKNNSNSNRTNNINNTSSNSNNVIDSASYYSQIIPCNNKNGDDAAETSSSHHKKKKKHKEKDKHREKEKKHKEKKRHKESKHKKEHHKEPHKEPTPIKITIPKEKLVDIPPLKFKIKLSGSNKDQQVITPPSQQQQPSNDFKFRISKDSINKSSLQHQSRKRHREYDSDEDEGSGTHSHHSKKHSHYKS